MGDIDLNAQGDITVGGDVVGRDKITTSITNIHEAAAPLALSLHQLPPPPRDFTGRAAELEELMAAVEKGGIAISGLHGLGGIGKTALALKLAELLTPKYPDAQFYLDLKGVAAGTAGDKPLTPAEALAHVVRAYHPTAKLPEGEAELRGLYHSVLHGQRALLLMDNAKDVAQVEPLIPPAGCLLLVTSRQHFTLPGLFAKNLEQMPPEDARVLLLKIAPRLASVETRDRASPPDEIAHLCGYLPLALRLTASALAERIDLSPADLIRRLQDSQTRLKLTGVDASLRFSYDLLASEPQKLWRALAVFPADFDRAAAAAVWKLEADPAQDALGELVRYSLLEYAPHPGPPAPLRSGSYSLPSGERESALPSPSGRGAGGEGELPGRYRLHDLARLFAASRLSDAERDAAQKRHAAHYAAVIGVAQQLYSKGGDSLRAGLALFDLEWPNIQHGQAWAMAHMGKDEEAVKACNWYGWQWDLLSLRFHPRDQIRWMEAGLAAARQLKDRQAEGAHLGNLGLAHADLGDARKAIEFYEQQLAIAREIGDRRGEGDTLGNLGNAHAALGDARKAIEFYEQQLVIDREIGDRRGEGTVLWNMSLALDSLGDRAQAIAHAQAALKIYEQIESPYAERVRKQLAGWRGENR
jgi:tetratricopeptide (TPR) repeat protein